MRSDPLLEILDRSGPSRRLAYHRKYHGILVFDAVIDLAHQQAKPALALSRLRDVAGDARRPHELPVPAFDR